MKDGSRANMKVFHTEGPGFPGHGSQPACPGTRENSGHPCNNNKLKMS